VRHNPEFTMLEFYQAYATYDVLMELTEDLFATIAKEAAGSLKLSYGDQEIDLKTPWRRLSLADSIVEYGGAERKDLADLDSLRGFAKKKDLRLEPGLPYGKLLVEVFEKLVEPLLIQPTFITGYPLEVSPLARKNDANPAFVDRFELYIGGRELANAFSELNDPNDQRERFENQAAARKAGDEEAHAFDEDYVRALEYGMPPAAGEGIGIDRLVMLFTASASIRDVILFPLLRPER
jgi:lysyl-tRNA synthetase class 2